MNAAPSLEDAHFLPCFGQFDRPRLPREEGDFQILLLTPLLSTELQ